MTTDSLTTEVEDWLRRRSAVQKGRYGMALNHAQIEWMRIARDAGSSGFVSQERRSLARLVSLGLLIRKDTDLPGQMIEWRATEAGLAALDEAEREAAPRAAFQVPALAKREQDLLLVAKYAGRRRGFSKTGRSRTLKRLLAFGLVEEVADATVSRWWRITDEGERIAKCYDL